MQDVLSLIMGCLFCTKIYWLFIPHRVYRARCDLGLELPSRLQQQRFRLSLICLPTPTRKPEGTRPFSAGTLRSELIRLFYSLSNHSQP